MYLLPEEHFVFLDKQPQQSAKAHARENEFEASRRP
jgi:hypothetical protein